MESGKHQTWLFHFFDICFRHVLDMFKTFVGHCLDMWKICSGHVTGMFHTRFRHYLNIYRACFIFIGTCLRHALDMVQTCVGHVSGMHCICFGLVVDMFRTILGDMWDKFQTRFYVSERCNAYFVWAKSVRGGGGFYGGGYPPQKQGIHVWGGRPLPNFFPTNFKHHRRPKPYHIGSKP